MDLDSELGEERKRFIHELGLKRKQYKRKWMELNSVANEHALILLPYHGMMSHLNQLVKDRNNFIYSSTRSFPKTHQVHKT